MERYYAYWLHSSAEVSFTATGTGGERSLCIRARVEGIDGDGYLLVRPLDGGEPVALAEKEYSFDILDNLVVRKTR